MDEMLRIWAQKTTVEAEESGPNVLGVIHWLNKRVFLVPKDGDGSGTLPLDTPKQTFLHEVKLYSMY